MKLFSLLAARILPLLGLASVLLNHAIGAPKTGSERSFIIYCAPNLPAELKKELKTEIQYFIAGGNGAANSKKWGMKPGDTLRIINAANRVQINKLPLQIPSNARTPALQLKSGTETIKAFLDFLNSDTGANPQSSNLNLPLILADEVPDASTDILFIGTPLYFDDVPAHDMRNGWLSDGYFNQDRSVTIFSVSGKKENLRSAKVRFCITDTVPWGTQNKLAHQEMVKRFWAIFIKSCGGQLTAFSPDLHGHLEALAADGSKPLVIDPPQEVDDKTMTIRQSLIEIVKQPEGKTVMSGQDVQLDVGAKGTGALTYQWKKDGVAIQGANSNVLNISRATRENSGTYSAIVTNVGGVSSESSPVKLVVQEPAPKVEIRPALQPQHQEIVEPGIKAIPDWLTISKEEYVKKYSIPKVLPAKDDVRIGLVWDTNQGTDIDLDLHVRISPSKEELSFRNTKTPEGSHYKDFSNSKANYGFELVDIDVPVVPENISISVNAFSGRTRGGFSAEVRVLYAGALAVFPIKIAAQEGNHGAGASQRERNTNWVRVPYVRPTPKN